MSCPNSPLKCALGTLEFTVQIALRSSFQDPTGPLSPSILPRLSHTTGVLALSTKGWTRVWMELGQEDGMFPFDPPGQNRAGSGKGKWNGLRIRLALPASPSWGRQ